MLRILHITPDNKFFDPVYGTWERNEDFENKALFYANRRNYQFQYIKRSDVLEIYYNKKDIKERLQRKDYDVVFVHSMLWIFFQFVSWIPEDRIVIWWGWGYDIYNSQFGLPPLVNIPLYKEKTLEFAQKIQFEPHEIIKNVISFFLKPFARDLQKKAVQRADYFQPVVKFEMDLMRQVEFFRAKEFYYKKKAPVFREFKEHRTNGNIIVGNSVSPTMNHLDILDFVLRYKLPQQKLIMPLSYGEEKYKEWLKPHLHHRDIQPIYDYMPRKEFYKMVDQCSYAIYGNLRQQAMGNINHDIAQGIKVFLYKDSIPFKNLISLGYVVFAIEDMDEKSLRTPLTKEQMQQNNIARQNEYNRRLVIYHNCMKEIRERLRTTIEDETVDNA